MHTIWTNPELNTAAPQVGYIGSEMPIDEWKGDHLVYRREDGSGICF